MPSFSWIVSALCILGLHTVVSGASGLSLQSEKAEVAGMASESVLVTLVKRGNKRGKKNGAQGGGSRQGKGRSTGKGYSGKGNGRAGARGANAPKDRTARPVSDLPPDVQKNIYDRLHPQSKRNLPR